MRSAHKDLESKLKEAEEKWELAENQLAEKISEFIREKAYMVEKRRKDNATLKSLQDDVQTLCTYMTMAEQG
jgi:predicted GTPase